MRTTGIFSPYRGGENRVTASILAVFRALALSRTERLIGALLEADDFELLRFRNQVAAKGHASVPDAEISANCRILVETKLVRNALRLEQLRGHLAHLAAHAEQARVLLVLTPDDSEPEVIADLADSRVTWASFAVLDQAIDDLLADRTEVISEREAFLLRELQRMLNDEHLVSRADDTIIVAASQAWQEYLDVHAYVCQAERSFQASLFLGFYSRGRIHELVPRIREVIDRVTFEPGLHAGAIGTVVDALLQRGARTRGDDYKIFLLSPPEASDTLRLPGSIENDLKAISGRTMAFTQGHRYVQSEQLRKARTTSDLISVA